MHCCCWSLAEEVVQERPPGDFSPKPVVMATTPEELDALLARINAALNADSGSAQRAELGPLRQDLADTVRIKAREAPSWWPYSACGSRLRCSYTEWLPCHGPRHGPWCVHIPFEGGHCCRHVPNLRALTHCQPCRRRKQQTSSSYWMSQAA